MGREKRMTAPVLAAALVLSLAADCGKEKPEEELLITGTTAPADTEPGFREVWEKVYVNGDTRLLSAPEAGAGTVARVRFQQQLTRTGIREDGWSTVVWEDSPAYVESRYLSDRKPDAPHAMYLGKDSLLQQEPDPGADYVLQLKAGTEVLVLEDLGEWSRVRAENQEGYVLTRNLQQEPPAETQAPTEPEQTDPFQKVRQTVWVTGTDEVNYRRSPEVKPDNLAGRIPRGQALERTGVYGQWSRVIWKGQQSARAENIMACNVYSYDDGGDHVTASFFYDGFAGSPGHYDNMLADPAHGIAVSFNMDPETGFVTCAMVLILDMDQWLAEENAGDQAGEGN